MSEREKTVDVPVELRVDGKGRCYLEVATDRSDANMVFKPEQKASLLKTIVDNELSMRWDACRLYGADVWENNQFPRVIPPLNTREGRNGDEKFDFYSPEEIAAIAKPEDIQLRRHWGKVQLWVFAKKWQRPGSGAARRLALNVKRVDVEPVKEANKPKAIQRSKA